MRGNTERRREAKLGEVQDTGSPDAKGRVRSLLGLLRVAVAVLLLVVLFRLVPPGEAVAQITAASPAPLVLSVLVAVVMMLVSAVKLWVLVRTRSPDAALWGVVRAYYVGAFFNNFLPTSIGGDVVKVHEVRALGVPLGHASASVVVERGTGVMVVLALAAVVPLAWGDLFVRLGLEPVRWPLAALGFGSLALFGLVYLLWRWGLQALLKRRAEHKVARAIRSVAESFLAFGDRPSALVWAVALSAIFYALTAVSILLVAQAVDARIGAAEAVGIVPLVKVPEMMPVSVGALGVREGAMSYCVARLGAGPARAAAVALILRLITWLNSAVGGLAYAMAPRRRRAETASGGSDA